MSFVHNCKNFYQIYVVSDGSKMLLYACSQCICIGAIACYYYLRKNPRKYFLNMDQKKKITLISVGVLELAVVLFCLIVSIMVLNSGYNGRPSSVSNQPQLIQWLCANPTWFFVLFVLPLIIIFLVDGVYLILYATKKESSLSAAEKDAIAEEAKRQAKEEILKELRAESERKE